MPRKSNAARLSAVKRNRVGHSRKQIKRQKGPDGKFVKSKGKIRGNAEPKTVPAPKKRVTVMPPSAEKLKTALDNARKQGLEEKNPAVIAALQACLDNPQPVDIRLPSQPLPAMNKAARTAVKKTLKKVVKLLHKPQPPGRLSADQQHLKAKPGSVRDISEKLGIPASTVQLWLELEDDIDPTGDIREADISTTSGAGGSNRRITLELLAVVIEWFKFRLERGVHTQQADIADFVLELEDVNPDWRPDWVKRKVAAVKPSGDPDAYQKARIAAAMPSQSVISRLCGMLRISSQAAGNMKRSRFRPTWELEVKEVLNNLNRFHLVAVVDEVGAHKHARPHRSLAFENQGGANILGEERGPAMTFVVCALLNM